MEVNYDILILVSQLLAQMHRFHEVSRMTRTCKFLHVECASLLLTPRHINLGGNEDFESFCRFMLADKRRRFPLLSQCPSLYFISADPLLEPVVDVLVEALQHVTTLHCLRFLGFERIMLSSPRIVPAFSALTGVHHLDIDTFNSTMVGKLPYVKLLKTLQSPLKGVKLLLPFSGGKHQHVSYNRNLDPIWLFSTFSSTLESIFLVGHIMVEGCSITQVYPRLTHLTVPKHSIPLVRPYIEAFPSLRVLNFDYSFFQWGANFIPTHSLLMHRLRGKVSEELRRDNREDQFARGSWTTLEYFMAMTLDAYLAGITCRLPSLHLITWGGSMDAEISAICDIFADARPSLFRLALRPAHIDYLAALFYERVELFSSLSSLELRLDVAAVPFDFESYLDTVGTALQRLPIVSLQVEIKCLMHIATKTLADPDYCDVPQYCYTLDAMSSKDIEGRLRYFLEKVRTLRRVTIAWGQCVQAIPHRFITMDLDNIPHTFERSGQHTDKHWQDGYRIRDIVFG